MDRLERLADVTRRKHESAGFLEVIKGVKKSVSWWIVLWHFMRGMRDIAVFTATTATPLSAQLNQIETRLQNLEDAIGNLTAEAEDLAVVDAEASPVDLAAEFRQMFEEMKASLGPTFSGPSYLCIPAGVAGTVYGVTSFFDEADLDRFFGPSPNIARAMLVHMTGAKVFVDHGQFVVVAKDAYVIKQVLNMVACVVQSKRIGGTVHIKSFSQDGGCYSKLHCFNPNPNLMNLMLVGKK